MNESTPEPFDPAKESREWVESLLAHPLTDDQIIQIAEVYAKLAIAQALQNKILK